MSKASSSAPAFSGTRMPSLDALRALAAFSVLLVHWGGWISGKVPDAPWLQKGIDWLMETMLQFYANEGQEFVGVILFIVLSGFCIHWPNAHLRQAPSWRQFAVRRFWRIYPVFLAASLLGLLVLEIAVRGGHQHAAAVLGYVPHRWWHVLAKLSGASHFFPGDSYQQTFLGDAPLATVVTEAWLYAFYPVVFWLRTRMGWPMVFLVAGAFYCLCPLLAVNGAGYAMIYRSILCYLIFWVMGAWVAELLKKEKLASSRALIGAAIAGLVLQVALVLVLPVRIGRFVSMLVQAAAFAALIAGLARRDRDAAAPRWFGWTRLAWLGERSYSIYAFHAPLMAAGLIVVLSRDATFSALSSFVILLSPVLLGMILYLLIESPAHRLARKLGKSRPET